MYIWYVGLTLRRNTHSQNREGARGLIERRLNEASERKEGQRNQPANPKKSKCVRISRAGNSTECESSHLRLGEFERRGDLPHERVFVAVLLADAAEFEGGSAPVAVLARLRRRRRRTLLSLEVAVLLRQTAKKNPDILTIIQQLRGRLIRQGAI